MEIIFLMFMGIGIFGSEFVKFQIAGVELIYMCLLAVFCYYIYEVVLKKRLKIEKEEWFWFAFIAYACASVVLSLTGITKSIVGERLPIDIRFLPRQAYYLVLLPVVFLTEPTKGKTFIENLLQNHSRKLVVLMFLLNVAIHKSLLMSIPTSFVLIFLSLRDEKHDWIDWVIFGLIVIPAFFADIQISNLLIRFIYVVCFLFQKRSKFISWSMAAGIWCCVGLCFVVGVFAKELSQMISDPNTVWRAQFWQDELKMLAESHYLGVGFGTAFCSTDFIDAATYIPWGDGDPFVATAQYSIYDKVFVTGAHNSFVTVAFRLGIVGIALFVTYLIWLHIRQIANIQKVSLRSYYALCSATVLIALNVGLESPYYMLLFLFAVCWSNYQLTCAMDIR